MVSAIFMLYLVTYIFQTFEVDTSCTESNCNNVRLVACQHRAKHIQNLIVKDILDLGYFSTCL